MCPMVYTHFVGAHCKKHKLYQKRAAALKCCSPFRCYQYFLCCLLSLDQLDDHKYKYHQDYRDRKSYIRDRYKAGDYV